MKALGPNQTTLRPKPERAGTDPDHDETKSERAETDQNAVRQSLNALRPNLRAVEGACTPVWKPSIPHDQLRRPPVNPGKTRQMPLIAAQACLATAREGAHRVVVVDDPREAGVRVLRAPDVGYWVLYS